MKTPIFFRKNELLSNEIILSAPEIEHIRSLRLFSKDKEIEIRDGQGHSGFYFIPADQKKGKLNRQETLEKEEWDVLVASAIPKGNRLDWLLQKGTELGVTEFIFVNFRRSERKDLGIERCERIIAEAASQSNRQFLPKISLCHSLEELEKKYQPLLFLLPEAKSHLKAESIQQAIPVIGPEGGFDDYELDWIEKKNLPNATLGQNILRIETAVLFMASLKIWFRASD